MTLFDVASVEELKEKRKIVDVNGIPVAIIPVNGKIVAIENVCAHKQGPVGEGDIEGNVITCPWHGWEFDLTTGKSLTFPTKSIRKFPVKIQNGRVFVEV